MSKHFRPWNIDQTLLLPPNVRDFVPKDHVSRFIVGLVRESLDLKAIMCSYMSGLGQPPFDPRMMVSLLLHGWLYQPHPPRSRRHEVSQPSSTIAHLRAYEILSRKRPPAAVPRPFVPSAITCKSK